MKLRTMAILCSTLFLNGCWFVFIPGSVISGIGDSMSGLEGQHCVAETAKVGDKIKHQNGSVGVVMKLEGTSSRCQNAAMPIRALVKIE